MPSETAVHHGAERGYDGGAPPECQGDAFESYGRPQDDDPGNRVAQARP
jgi:hypothetical protein